MSARVLFVDHVGVLGGAELSLLDVITHRGSPAGVVLFADGPFRERLERAGVAVEVLAASRSVKGIRREGGGWRDLRALPGVLDLVRRLARRARDYDVLYANSQKAFVVGVLAGKLAGRPVIWHLRDVLAREHFSSLHRRMVVFLANVFAARVIANSKTSAAAFVESGGRAGKVRVVYNGIDSAPFDAVTPAEVEDVRRDLGLGEAPVVGAFSRLAPWKGQHVLLEALCRLPGVHALLVGEALFGEGDYEKTLREKAEALGIAERVHFLGFRDDVPRLMRSSDVVVHTSVAAEPFGRMIVEGMLAERPVVAGRAGGALEILDHDATGLLFPPGDPAALADTLAGLLADPARSRALAEAGYAAATERFSLSAMLKGVERQVREVAGR